MIGRKMVLQPRSGTQILLNCEQAMVRQCLGPEAQSGQGPVQHDCK